MANWVHCNKCFEQLQKNKTIGFYLTECGHIACEKCSEKIRASNACIMCRKPTRVMKLCKDMDSSVRNFFNPLDIQFKKCIEIYNFQNNHKESFLANYVQKYEYAKNQCMKQYSLNNKLMQEKKTLRAMIQKSCDRDGPISSTPIGKNISFQNTSLSTITPERSFKFGSVGSRGHPSLFTPMKAVPGFAQRLSASKLSNQSNVSQGISPAQVVPMFGRFNKPSVPIHRPPLGPMSSLHELQMANRFKL